MSKITKHYFEHNNRKYFRGNAENVELCSYGEKKDPIGPNAYLDVENRIQRELVAPKVKALGTVAIDWAQVSKVDGGAKGQVNAFGVKGERAAETSIGVAEKGNYKLVGFAVDAGPLRVLLNTEADGARNFLEREGNDGRIVSEIWVVMEAEYSSAFSISASYSVSASVVGVGLDITASGTSAGTKKITLSAGSTFAYLLHKVKKWNKGKTKIEDLEADYKGGS
ncbi:hypothetical protein ASA1KI_27300 [Opitutales bacterium ASA1]|uniref:hypothetical protein n=1 Tax=Congregicoccus parvus TaxID=3081749 RepID=UPI002B2B98C3|nr:hypothetical protein ASA1KI_27300 [Opitutales bacterium ASA1]